MKVYSQCRWLAGILHIIIIPATVSAQTNLVQNGDFESGLNGWNIVVLNEGAPDYPVIDVKDSHFCPPGFEWTDHFFLDVPLGSDGFAQQAIDLPDGPLELTFMTWGNHDPVTARVSILAGGGETLLDSFTPPLTEQQGGGCSGATPVEKSYNISQFAGQEITLRFRAFSADDKGIGTFANFDDVQILTASEEEEESEACAELVHIWTGGDGSFSEETNWDPEGPPDSDAIARFDQDGQQTILFDSSPSLDVLDVQRGFVIADLGTQLVTLTGESGCGPSLKVETTFDDGVPQGGLFLDNGTLFAGDDAHISAPLVSGLGLPASLAIFGEALVGRTAVGRLALLGKDNTLDMATDKSAHLVIGDQEFGDLVVADRAEADISKLTVGRQADGEALISVVGRLQVFEEMIIGAAGVGLVTVSDSGYAQSDSLTIVGAESGSQGSLVVTGPESQFWLVGETLIGRQGKGALRIEDQALALMFSRTALGYSTDSEGRILVSNANLSMSLSANAWLVVGDKGNGIMTGDSSSIDLVRMTIGATGSGTTEFARSNLSFGGPLVLGDEASAFGKLAATDSTTISHGEIEQDIVIGHRGTGTLELRTKSALYPLGDIIVGNLDGSEGTLAVSGPGSWIAGLSTQTDLIIGNEGKGDMQVVDEALVDLANVWIGKATGGFGSAFVGGVGTKMHAENLAVGTGSFGILQVADGGLVTAGQLWIGNAGQVLGAVIEVGTPGNTSIDPAKVDDARIQTQALLLSEDAEIDVASIVMAPDAVLGGTVTWREPIANTGGISPGDLENPAGTFTAADGYRQGRDATLYIDLGDREHDQLVVEGSAGLDGTLQISLLPGYVPVRGEAFKILVADEISGAFASVVTAEDLEVEVSYSTDAVTVAVTNYRPVAIEEEAAVPASFTLNQNYPNPFNPQTVIGYELAEPGRVTLVVYDLLGREIRRLVDTNRPRGRHDVVFDAGDLPGGIYVYQLTMATGETAAAQTATRRMVLLR